MKFIEKLLRVLGTLRRKPVTKAARDIYLIRQNSPPDERDVDVAEEIAFQQSTSGAGDKSQSPKKPKLRAKKAAG